MNNAQLDHETPPSHQLRARVEAALVRGETQTSLSIASGVTRSKISDWLAGKCTMTLGTADRLWAACGFSSVSCDASFARQDRPEVGDAKAWPQES